MNVSWRDCLTNEQLYGNLCLLSDIIKEQRVKFEGDCWRAKNEIVSEVILWEPTQGRASRGQQAKTYMK